MPSSNIRDDLPSYYERASIVRQLAEAVIQNLGPKRQTGFVPRVGRPKEAPAAEAEMETHEAARPQHDTQAAGREQERRALSAGPQRTFAEAAQNGERQRERIRSRYQGR